MRRAGGLVMLAGGAERREARPVAEEAPQTHCPPAAGAPRALTPPAARGACAPTLY